MQATGVDALNSEFAALKSRKNWFELLRSDEQRIKIAKTIRALKTAQLVGQALGCANKINMDSQDSLLL